MKRLLFLSLAALVALSAISCNKDDELSEEDNVQVYSLGLLSPSEYSAFIGDVFKVEVAVEPADVRIRWSSSSPYVASVSSDGEVTALQGGYTTITAAAGRLSTSCEVRVIEPENLSESESANCYLINSPGYYAFDLKKGNSDEWVEGVASLEVLWESYGTTVITPSGEIIRIHKLEDKTAIVYTSNADLMHDGNAVVAARDADGNILWSWHFWLCKWYNPLAGNCREDYLNGAGTVMDRCLGSVGSMNGLMYQWGRKDPFLGRVNSTETAASSLRPWPAAVLSSSTTGTIDYSIKNPTTFISSSGTDWLYTANNGLWGSTKTKYDPCPPGWRVPDGGPNGVWATAFGTSEPFSYYWNVDDFCGMSFGGEMPLVDSEYMSVWYPAVGYLDAGDSWKDYNKAGSFWSCTATGTKAYCFHIDGHSYPYYAYPSFEGNRVEGYAIRCVLVE